jgi:hypothetical protein
MRHDLTAVELQDGHWHVFTGGREDAGHAKFSRDDA